MVVVFALAGALAALLVGSALGLFGASAAGQLAALGALVILILAATTAARGLRRLSRPIDALIEAAGRIEEGDYTARVPERGPREVRTLARAFNGMSARLEATEGQRRTFLADVTHELRTPLAVIRAEAEAIADGIHPADAEHLAPILEATRTLELLSEDLRTVALTDAGALLLAREPVDLAILVNATVGGFEPAAGAAEVRLETDLAPDLPVLEIDPIRIRSVVANLLANAIRHTPPGGRVTISGRVTGDAVEVVVTDTGTGIPPDLLAHVFDRFVKDPDSSGSGLGLAIARDLVEAHGGRIAAESGPGGGTTIRFGLPIGPPGRPASAG
jgi:two-component system sensor histidine kinase BaeS